MPTSAAGHSHPSIPLPPSFADFKFLVIGQPPQLLKRMGATPPPDFRHSPTPMHMDLQYPSRAATPWAPATPSQPSLQQRLESADFSTALNSEGFYLPTDHSDHPPEKKPAIDVDTLITSPQLSSTRQISLDNSPIFHESRPTPATSSSNTHATSDATPAGQRIILPTMSSPYLPIQTTLTPASSMGVFETHHSSKSQLVQIQSDMELSYESALIAFEKAERSLSLAQETYDAAKATLTAVAMIRARFTQPLITDAHRQHTSEGNASRSITTLNDQDMTDAAEPIITEISGDLHISPTVHMPQKPPIQRIHHLARHLSTATLAPEKKDISGRITELEREADDVRLAWSSLSSHKSLTTPAPRADKPSFSATESHIRNPLGTSAEKLPRPQSSTAGIIAEPTIIVKDEDITDADDHQRPHVLGRETHSLNSSSLSGIAQRIDSSSSHIPIDNDADRTTLALVSESSRPAKDVVCTRTTAFPLPTGLHNTPVIVNSSDQHAPKAPSSAPCGSSANPIELDDTAEDEDLSSGRTRSESIPISLGEDISNELEVERELEKEDSVPCSPPSSSRVSRSSSTQPVGTPDDNVGEPRAKPTPISRPEQDIIKGSITTQGLKSELHRGSALLPSSPQGDHNSANANTLLQRLQSAPAVSLSESEPESNSVTNAPASSPSVLGKRRHLDPPSPKTRPTAAFPIKRRHFTDTHDSPSLESRISEVSTIPNEPERSDSSTSLTHYRGGHINFNKHSFVPRNRYIPPAERSLSPPSGPRAIRQESVYRKNGSAAPSRPPSESYYSPFMDRPLGGSDSYSNRKSYGPGLRKKFIQVRPITTSSYDQTRGVRLGQHRVTDSPKDNVGSPRSTMRPPPPFERREISLADRLRDP